MSKHSNPPSWWGAPKKFNPNFEERKISWLELFFDLVYVIAISRITHMLCGDLSIANFLWYCSLFALIFWGWLNGSLYHDIHGNVGLRTRLMTLWQMVIISALSVTLDHSHDAFSESTTIILMLMQIFITYLWWSVGFYDREHRKYNVPYTILFLLSFGVLGLNFVLPHEYRPLLIIAILIFNYSPPFITSRILNRNSLGLSLSSSMTERLGLFTIIVFGEVVLGVVNGVSGIAEPGFNSILVFLIALAIVFALWWIFFTLISNRNAKPGFVRATVLEILYFPILISLGLIAASFTLMFNSVEVQRYYSITCLPLALFPASISIMMGMLIYPGEIESIYKKVRASLFITSLVFIAFAPLAMQLETTYFLFIVLIILISEIAYLNSLYYRNISEPREAE
ncbi:MAG: low temperature requirement protein A [Bacteroidota bacterium]